MSTLNTTNLKHPDSTDNNIVLSAGGGITVSTLNGRAPGLTLGTAVASTSGTAIDFNNIPSWAKRITVMFNGVSTNGSSDLLLRIGAGSIETTGYVGATIYTTGGSSSAGLLSAGFLFIYAGGHAPQIIWHGAFTLTLLNPASNLWVVSGTLGRSDAAASCTIGGSKALSGVLDRIRLTTANGTDVFDAGSVNILYEG